VRNQRSQSHQSTASDLAARHRRAVPERPARRPSGEISNARRSATSRGRASRATLLKRAWTALQTAIAFGLAVGIIAGGAFAYGNFTDSGFFTLRNVELRGNLRAPRDELLSSLYQNTSRGLWWTDLDELRGKLRQHPWVRDAEVVRVLPDTLRVTINEREPFALARLLSGTLVWVDRDGVVLDEQGAFKGAGETERVVPLLSGLIEGSDAESREANRKQLQTFEEVVKSLDQGEPSLLDRVDEIHFDELDGLHLQISGRPVKVIASLEDVHGQVEKALAVLDAIDRRDVSALELFRVTDATRLFGGVRINYINTRSPARLVIGLVP